MFLANLSLRPVCFQCKYASSQRVGDITLGDFWGVQKDHPELFDGKGTSLVMANTDNGVQMLMNLQEEIVLKAVDAPAPLPPNLVEPSPMPGLRNSFLKSLQIQHGGSHRLLNHLLALGVIAKTKLLRGIKAALGLD